MLASSKRDVAKSIKTLLVMLQSMKDQQVTITLRNDTLVSGTITSVDSNMNIELRDASIAPDPFYNTTATPVLEGINDDDSSPKTSTFDNDVASTTDNLSDSTSSDVKQCDSQVPHPIIDGPIDYSDSSSDEYTDQTESEQLLSYFLVKGSRIRHIDVPADIDLLEQTKGEIERIRNRRKQWSKRDIIRSN